MSHEAAKLQDEISSAFRDGKILTASEEELKKYLMSLCTEHIPNDMVRHRETIRALTINHIQMQRHIDKLNKQNTILQYLVIALTIASLIGTAVQTYKILQPEAQMKSTVSETILKPTAITQQKQINKATTEKTNIPAEATRDGSATSPQPPNEKKK